MSSNQNVSARMSSRAPSAVSPPTFRQVVRTAKRLVLSASLAGALLLGIGATPAFAHSALSANGTGGPTVFAPTYTPDNGTGGPTVFGDVQPNNGTGGPTVF